MDYAEIELAGVPAFLIQPSVTISQADGPQNGGAS